MTLLARQSYAKAVHTLVILLELTVADKIFNIRAC